MKSLKTWLEVNDNIILMTSVEIEAADVPKSDQYQWDPSIESSNKNKDGYFSYLKALFSLSTDAHDVYVPIVVHNVLSPTKKRRLNGDTGDACIIQKRLDLPRLGTDEKYQGEEWNENYLRYLLFHTREIAQPCDHPIVSFALKKSSFEGCRNWLCQAGAEMVALEGTYGQCIPVILSDLDSKWIVVFRNEEGVVAAALSRWQTVAIV